MRPVGSPQDDDNDEAEEHEQEGGEVAATATLLYVKAAIHLGLEARIHECGSGHEAVTAMAEVCAWLQPAVATLRAEAEAPEPEPPAAATIKPPPKKKTKRKVSF